MKLSSLRRSFFVSSLAALALAAVGCGGSDTTGASASSLTATTGPQAEARGRWNHRRDPAQLVQRFDANGDGALQLAELPAPMQARLGAADADHNGVIATTELTAHMEARRAERLARADTDHDGTVSAEEAAAGRGHGFGRGRGFGRGGRGGHAPDPARMIQRLDANGDGTLQVTELPAPMRARMTTADANHDGVIAADELTAAIAAHRAEREAQRAAGADDHDAE